MVADEMPPDMPDPVFRDWSPPDEAGVSHYRGPAPASATVLDAHTYIGPRIEALVDGGRLRVVCVCGWRSDPLRGVLLADAASLYGTHLEEVTRG